MAYYLNYGNFLGFILDPLIKLDPNPENPILLIIVIGSLIALFIVLLQKKLIDFDLMREMQDEAKQLQNDMRAAQKSGDPKALAKVQKRQAEFMPKQMDLMKMQMKPTFITIVPIMVIYAGLAGNTVIYNMIINIAPLQNYLLLEPIWCHFWQPVIPNTINFFGLYIIVSFAMSFFLRKILGLR